MKIFNFRQEKPAWYPLVLTLSFVYKNNDNAIFEASIIIKISIISSPITEWWQTMQMYKILLYVRRDSRAAISIPFSHPVEEWLVLQRPRYSHNGLWLSNCLHVCASRSENFYFAVLLDFWPAPRRVSCSRSCRRSLFMCQLWLLVPLRYYLLRGSRLTKLNFFKGDSGIQSKKRRCACL